MSASIAWVDPPRCRDAGLLTETFSCR